MKILASTLLLAAFPSALAAQNPRILSRPTQTDAAPRAVSPQNAQRLQQLLRRDSVSTALSLLDTHTAAAGSCDTPFNVRNTATWSALRGSVAQCVWGSQGVQGLDLATLTAGSNSAGAYSDVVAAYFGPLRASLATMVAGASNDSAQTTSNDLGAARAALQRLVSGGGNLLATVQLPLVRINLPQVNNFELALMGTGRAASSVKALGASEGTNTANYAGAINGQLTFKSNDKSVLVFGYWRSEAMTGSGDLIQRISQSATPSSGDTTTVAGKHFGYSRGSVGAMLWNSVVVTATRPFFCSECKSLGVGNQLSIAFQKKGP